MKKRSVIIAMELAGLALLSQPSFGSLLQHTSSTSGQNVAVNAVSQGAHNASGVVLTEYFNTQSVANEFNSFLLMFTPSGDVFQANPGSSAQSATVIAPFGKIPQESATQVNVAFKFPTSGNLGVFDPVGKKIFASNGAQGLQPTPLLTSISNVYISTYPRAFGLGQKSLVTLQNKTEIRSAAGGNLSGYSVFNLAVDADNKRVYNLLDQQNPTTPYAWTGDALAPGSTIVNAAGSGVWTLSPSGVLSWIPFNTNASPATIATGVKQMGGTISAVGDAQPSVYFLTNDGNLKYITTASPTVPTSIKTGVSDIVTTSARSVYINSVGGMSSATLMGGVLALNADKSATYFGESFGVFGSSASNGASGAMKVGTDIAGSFSQLVTLPYGQAGLMDEGGSLWAPKGSTLSAGFGMSGYPAGQGFVKQTPLNSWVEDASGVYIERTAGANLEIGNPSAYTDDWMGGVNPPTRVISMSMDAFKSMQTAGYKTNVGGAFAAYGNPNATINMPPFLSASDDVWFDGYSTILGLKSDGTVVAGGIANSGDQLDGCWYSSGLPADGATCPAKDGNFHEILPLAQPVNVAVASGQSNSAVTVSWKAVPTIAYQVYVAPKGSAAAAFTMAGETAAGASSFQITGLNKATAYDVYVVAKRLQIGSSSIYVYSAHSQTVTGATAFGPTSVTANVAISANSTATEVKPVVSTKDPSPVYTYSLSGENPVNGAVAAQNGKLLYTPNKDFYGHDSFGFTVTDAAGNSLTGVAQVDVSCGAPTIAGVTVPTAMLPQYSAITASVKYNSDTCNGGVSVTTELLDSTYKPIDSYTQTSVGADGLAQAINFPANDLPAGQYFVRTTVTSKASQKSAQQMSAGFKTYQMLPPYIALANNSIMEEDPFSASIKDAKLGCASTSNVAEAKADPTKCLVEWATLPAPLALPADLAVSGYGSPVKNQLVSANVSVFDSKGGKHSMGAIVAYQDILATIPPAFNASVPASINQYFDWVKIVLNKSSLGGMACTVMTDRAAAIAATAAGAAGASGQPTKVCLVEFNQADIPVGMSMNKDAANPEIDGRYMADGQAKDSIGYTVSKVVAGKEPVQLSTGIIPLKVANPPLNTTLTPSLNPVGASVQKTVVTLANPKTTAAFCPSYSSNESDAVVSSGKQGPLTCLVKWTSIPQGMEQGTDPLNPSLSGMPSVVGTQNVHADVFALGIGQDGKTTQYKIGDGLNLALTVNEPVPPTFQVNMDPNLKAVTYQDGTAYLVPTSGIVGSVVVTQANLGGVKLIADEGGQYTDVNANVTLGYKVPVKLNHTDVAWAIKDEKLTVAYAGLAVPVQAERVIKTIQLPPASMNGVITSSLVNVSTTDPFDISATFGNRQVTGGYVYTPANHGLWKATLVDASDVANPVSVVGPLPVGADGTVTFKGVKYSDVAGKKLAVRFVPDVDIPNSVSAMTPVARTTFVKTEAPSSAVVSAAKLTGPAPMALPAHVAFSNEDVAIVETINWFVSSDDGANYALVEGAKGVSPRINLDKPGVYKVRAVAINKYSGKTFTTNEISVMVYDELKVTIDGSTLALPGTSVALHGTAASSTGQSPNMVYQWLVNAMGSSEVKTYDGQDIVLNSDTAQGFNVTLKVRPNLLPENDPNSWKSSATTVKFSEPKLIGPRLFGMAKTEVGATTTYSTIPALPWKPSEHSAIEIKRAWVLPSGQEVEGVMNNVKDVLSWAPTDADFQMPQPVVLGYKQWMVGRESDAIVTTAKVTVTKYIWPEFKLTQKCDTALAPSTCFLSVEGASDEDKKNASTKRLTYEWTLSDGLTFRSTDAVRPKLAAMANMPGSYPVSVLVRDDRGNKATVSGEVVATAFQPYNIKLTLIPALKYNRNPMTYAIKAAISGGHPKDHVTKYGLSVNGEPVTLTRTDMAPRSVVMSTAGEFDVKLDVQSQFGNTGEGLAHVTVNPNQKASCDSITGQFNMQYKTLAFAANRCLDTDGKIVKYLWSINDVDMPKITGLKGGIPLDPAVDTYTVKLTLTDDSGETSEVVQTFTKPAM